MNIHEFLKQKGYSERKKEQYKDDLLFFYKKVPNTNLHQFIINEWKINAQGRIFISYDIGMIYNTHDDVWVDSKFYALSAEILMEKLEILEQRLHSSVEIMGGDKSTYKP